MLKRPITYTDFNDEVRTDIFYFNISKPELVELDVEFDGGFGGMIKHIEETKDNKTLIATFKKIILLAYGQKSEDGKSFEKSDAMREAFSQTAAYNQLFMDLATDDTAAVTFLTGVLPKDLAKDLANDPRKDLPAPSDLVPSAPVAPPVPPA